MVARHSTLKYFVNFSKSVIMKQLEVLEHLTFIIKGQPVVTIVGNQVNVESCTIVLKVAKEAFLVDIIMGLVAWLSL